MWPITAMSYASPPAVHRQENTKRSDVGDPIDRCDLREVGQRQFATYERAATVDRVHECIRVSRLQGTCIADEQAVSKRSENQNEEDDETDRTDDRSPATPSPADFGESELHQCVPCAAAAGSARAIRRIESSPARIEKTRTASVTVSTSLVSTDRGKAGLEPSVATQSAAVASSEPTSTRIAIWMISDEAR